MASPRATGDYMRPAFGLLLEKLAYGPEDVTKVLKAVKPLHRTVPNIPPATATPDVNMISLARRAAVTAQKLRPDAHLPNNYDFAADHDLAVSRGEALQVKLPRARISTVRGPNRERYNEVRAIRDAMAPGMHLDDKNMRAASSIIRGHELDEIGAARRAPSYVTLSTGHMSPTVVFREHNRVATLPPELSGAKELLQRMRARNENPVMFDRLGLDFGNSPRLSRHAIKRLTESLERKNVRLGFHGEAPAGASNAQIRAINDAASDKHHAELARQRARIAEMDADPKAYAAKLKREELAAQAAHMDAMSRATDPAEIDAILEANQQRVADFYEQLRIMSERHSRFRYGDKSWEELREYP